MDSKQRNEIRNIIKKYISSNKGFSTRQIKNEFKTKGMNISASEISTYLKKKFEKDHFDSDYNVSQLEHNNIKFTVYHPISEIPDSVNYFSDDIIVNNENKTNQIKENKQSSRDIVGFNFR